VTAKGKRSRPGDVLLDVTDIRKMSACIYLNNFANNWALSLQSWHCIRFNQYEVIEVACLSLYGFSPLYTKKKGSKFTKYLHCLSWWSAGYLGIPPIDMNTVMRHVKKKTKLVLFDEMLKVGRKGERERGEECSPELYLHPMQPGKSGIQETLRLPSDLAPWSKHHDYPRISLFSYLPS
jgi:hypothetical protein